MKRLPVRWAASASVDLIEILEFIQDDRPDAARKVVRDILRATAHLNRQPRSGKVVRELREQGVTQYREISVWPYRVIYAIRTQSIEILAVLDGRRDLQSALLRRLLLN